MNILIAKRASILALMLGAALGIISLIPFFMGLGVFILSFLSAPLVLFFMKKKTMIGFLDNEQGAILGAMIGFCTSIGFYVIFIPLVTLIHFIFRSYYSYGIPYFFRLDTFWLFILIIVMIGLLLALTNAVAALGMVFVFNYFEEKPKDIESIDIKID